MSNKFDKIFSAAPNLLSPERVESKTEVEKQPYVVLEVGPDANPSQHLSPDGPLYRMRHDKNIQFIGMQPKSFHKT